MSHIHVCLVSEQTIPNILVACKYKPDTLWFFTTKKMKEAKKTECIKNTLSLKGILPHQEYIREMEVDQDSLMDCMNKIESLIEEVDSEKEYIVNLTGGNKIMAIAAYEIFREIGQKVVIGYVPLGRNEFIQIFPRKKPLKVYDIRERLNLEEYICSYGFRIQNKESLFRLKEKTLSRTENSKWILDNYEHLKGLLGFLYKNLGDKRKQKTYIFSHEYDRKLSDTERDFLRKFSFSLHNSMISKEMVKDEVVFFTGGWFEEFVFDETVGLVQDGVLDDAWMGVKIESLSGAVNDLDIAFMKNNMFYHIECKTLGEGNKNIINEEVYKKGAISTLLGKGEKRAIICTTLTAIEVSSIKKARDYGVEIFTIEWARNLRKNLKEIFGITK